MKVRAEIFRQDASDPLTRFVQVGVRIDRDDGKTWSWRGKRIPDDSSNNRQGLLQKAIASAVEAMLEDTTVLEFGMTGGAE